ncbi:FecR family protein [Cupriavidus necator]
MKERPELMDSVKAAIQWEVLLRSGEATAEERARFEAWRKASSANDAAWNRLQGKLRPFQSIGSLESAAAGRQALLSASDSRRRFLKAGLKGTAGLAVVSLLGYRIVHEFGFDANFRTGIGEQKTVSLTPGLSALLDAGTAIYSVRGELANTWRLDSGRMLVNGTDSDQGFELRSAHGTVRSNGGARLSLSLFATHSQLALEAGSATLTLREGQTQQVVTGGIVSFSERESLSENQSLTAAFAWTSGLLVASNQSIADVVSVLRRYRRGYIRVAANISNRRVSGVFNLKDPDTALRQLAETMSLRVNSYGPYLVVLQSA